MLNFFPELLPFGLISATIIRIVVGSVLFYFGILSISTKKEIVSERLNNFKYPAPKFFTFLISIIGIITGSFLIAGFATQIVAIIAIYLFLNLIFIDSGEKNIFGQTKLFYISMILISITLIFSGAGFWAIDLPL
ncbi:MAG TPA: DoxX family protein [Candidatus Paceibacterota bacterium]|nr:DoxX family protein [Candidatus Paceibacterota bacterium]HMP18974.1 DoxX family protein [Candidatus Paceibacterota bacterium]HMP85404.1 DoxX family protein [Candidatus Paceibacterota bacterium]